MKFSPHHAAGFAGLGATVLVLVGTWAFALARPEYSHIRHTISELGESGAPLASLVSFGFFLPTGVLVWLAIVLAYPCYARDRSTYLGLCAFASLGLGYVMAAFFPCDPGSPLMGSWQQQVHNVFGLVEYLGTGAALIAFGWSQTKAKSYLTGLALVGSGVAVFIGLVLLSTPSWVSVRGLVQRITEAIIFGWLTLASLSLIFRCTQPNQALKWYSF
ncbi:MAG TPA: DUF998 domain-containing protein [Nitrospira sp.]|nr:DUF998 domain-containing protein [Nitrospira sp.]